MGNITGQVDRDVELMFPGDRFPVSAGPALRVSGWPGGQWVMYVVSPEGDYVVEASDGNAAAGFLLQQSESNRNGSGAIPRRLGGGAGSPTDWTNIQYRRSHVATNTLTMVNGGTRALFSVFETVSVVAGARTGPALVYTVQDDLKISENGLLCNDTDGALATVGIAAPVVVGIVSAVPSDLNGGRLSMDMKF
jgi:hypothetical protein